MKIVEKLQEDISQLNATCRADWGDRFELVLIDYIGNNNRLKVYIQCIDNLLNETCVDIVSYYKFSKKYITANIWDSFNNFVNACLDKRSR